MLDVHESKAADLLNLFFSFYPAVPVQIFQRRSLPSRWTVERLMWNSLPVLSSPWQLWLYAWDFILQRLEPSLCSLWQSHLSPTPSSSISPLSVCTGCMSKERLSISTGCPMKRGSGTLFAGPGTPLMAWRHFGSMACVVLGKFWGAQPLSPVPPV